MFTRRPDNRFRHTYIYVDEHKDKIDGIRQRAADELNMESGEYRASKIKGFLTNKKYKHRISTTTAITLIVLSAVLWYFLIY